MRYLGCTLAGLLLGWPRLEWGLRRDRWYLYGGIVAGVVAARMLPPELNAVLLVFAAVIGVGCIVSLRFYP